VESRAALFVEVMVAIAIIGVLAFLVGLVARSVRPPQPAGTAAGDAGQAPQWYEFILALLLLAAVGALLLWLVASGRQWVLGEAVADWQADSRAIVFTAVMIAFGAIGLIASVAYTIIEAARRAVPHPLDDVRAPAAAAAAAVPTGSGARVLGLLALAVALLLLCWIALDRAEQHALMAQLVYPASLGVGLVLLFDKAARGWSSKAGAEVLREWLLCDTIVFLLCLGFLNLRSLEKPDAYAGSFWDLLVIVLSFATFWLLDRKATRFRFLVAYGYLVILPLLLLIWRSVAGAAAPGGVTWWGSIWPVFALAVIFFVVEIITLLASAPERQTVPAVKDALFVLLYGILLIAAAAAGAHP
jgi:hypothetical protein